MYIDASDFDVTFPMKQLAISAFSELAMLGPRMRQVSADTPLSKQFNGQDLSWIVSWYHWDLMVFDGDLMVVDGG